MNVQIGCRDTRLQKSTYVPNVGDSPNLFEPRFHLIPPPAMPSTPLHGNVELSEITKGGLQGMGGRGAVARRHRVMEPQNELEAAFLAAMMAENLSAETIRQRIYLLRGLGVPATQAQQEDVQRVLNQRSLSAHSKASYVAVYKALFSDLVRHGLVDHDPTRRMKTPKSPRRHPRPIPDSELRRLEAMPRQRERAWTILGAYAGLRAGEVVTLPGTALVTGTHGTVLRVTGKGGVTADIPAHPKVIQVLLPYSGLDEPIWPMWPQSLDRAWKLSAAEVDVHDRVFHQLRHSFATRLTQQGVPLLVVADLCRHASVATTQRYAAVASDAPFQAIVGL